MNKIKFSYTDEFGYEYSAESSFDGMWETDGNNINTIGSFLNTFLKQVGFNRENDLIFMRDVTPNEYDAIDKFLTEYRLSTMEDEF